MPREDSRWHFCEPRFAHSMASVLKASTLNQNSSHRTPDHVASLPLAAIGERGMGVEAAATGVREHKTADHNTW